MSPPPPPPPQSDNMTSLYWLASKQQQKLPAVATDDDVHDNDNYDIDCLCIGTGRFLRSVLVPILIQAGYVPAFIQTRGNQFTHYMKTRSGTNGNNTYEVDTVLETGVIQTDHIPCYGVFSFGTVEGKETISNVLLPRMKQIRFIGIGVTEAGLASYDTPVMKDLYELFLQIHQSIENGKMYITNECNKICVLNTDNVPNNGNVLRSHMEQLSQNNPTMIQFFTDKVVFLNSMVDRITSQRENSNGLIPSAEPVPVKAFVVLDTDHVLPLEFKQLQLQLQIQKQQESNNTTTNTNTNLGLIVRTSNNEIDNDIALKLRIANGTHTSIAHLMALLQYTMTDTLALSTTKKDDDTEDNGVHHSKLFMAYLDALVMDQIIPGTRTLQNKDDNNTVDDTDALEVWLDWKKRLLHPYFGLSTFFITQNGAAKVGIRLGPTIIDLFKIQQQQYLKQEDDKKPTTIGITVVMALNIAIILRWLTPACCTYTSENADIYKGWFPSTSRSANTTTTFDSSSTDVVVYADGLKYNLTGGWYEFRCPLTISIPNHNETGDSGTLCQYLYDATKNTTEQHYEKYVDIIRTYLIAPSGGNLSWCTTSSNVSPDLFDIFVRAVAIYYFKIVDENINPITILNEMYAHTGIYTDTGMQTDCSTLVQ